MPEGKEDAALLLLGGGGVRVLHMAPLDILGGKGCLIFVGKEGIPSYMVSPDTAEQGWGG